MSNIPPPPQTQTRTKMAHLETQRKSIKASIKILRNLRAPHTTINTNIDNIFTRIDRNVISQKTPLQLDAFNEGVLPLLIHWAAVEATQNIAVRCLGALAFGNGPIGKEIASDDSLLQLAWCVPTLSSSYVILD